MVSGYWAVGSRGLMARIGPGRQLFDGGGWHVVVDEVQGADDLVKKLEEAGGFAITHVARVERPSGGTFSVGELEEFTEAFSHFWRLCAEARCGPAFPVGFDTQGHPAWSRWHPTGTEPFPNASTWLDKAHPAEAEALFTTFMDRMATPYWRLVLTHAIAYLIDATRPDTVERAITMAQVLLEAVSYSWLVEERKLRTHDEYEERKAVQNIREMLMDMKVPVAIPTKLTALAATRNPKGHPVDGPQALCTSATRSCIVGARHRSRATTQSLKLGASAPGTASWSSSACAASMASTAIA